MPLSLRTYVVRIEPLRLRHIYVCLRGLLLLLLLLLLTCHHPLRLNRPAHAKQERCQVEKVAQVTRRNSKGGGEGVYLASDPVPYVLAIMRAEQN